MPARDAIWSQARGRVSRLSVEAWEDSQWRLEARENSAAEQPERSIILQDDKMHSEPRRTLQACPPPAQLNANSCVIAAQLTRRTHNNFISPVKHESREGSVGRAHLSPWQSRSARAKPKLNWLHSLASSESLPSHFLMDSLGCQVERHESSNFNSHSAGEQRSIKLA